MKIGLSVIILTVAFLQAQAAQYINKQLSEFESGNWSVYSSAESADEEYILSVSSRLYAKPGKYSKPDSSADIQPNLEIYCREQYIQTVGAKYELYLTINWPVMLIHGQKEIISVFDDGINLKQNWLDVPGEAQRSTSLTENNAKRLLKKLLKTKKYTVKSKTSVAKFNKNVLVSVEDKEAFIEFEMQGIDKAIVPITKYCPI